MHPRHRSDASVLLAFSECTSRKEYSSHNYPAQGPLEKGGELDCESQTVPIAADLCWQVIIVTKLKLNLKLHEITTGKKYSE